MTIQRDAPFAVDVTSNPVVEATLAHPDLLPDAHPTEVTVLDADEAPLATAEAGDSTEASLPDLDRVDRRFVAIMGLLTPTPFAAMFSAAMPTAEVLIPAAVISGATLATAGCLWRLNRRDRAILDAHEATATREYINGLRALMAEGDGDDFRLHLGGSKLKPRFTTFRENQPEDHAAVPEFAFSNFIPVPVSGLEQSRTDVGLGWPEGGDGSRLARLEAELADARTQITALTTANEHLRGELAQVRSGVEAARAAGIRAGRDEERALLASTVTHLAADAEASDPGAFGAIRSFVERLRAALGLKSEAPVLSVPRPHSEFAPAPVSVPAQSAAPAVELAPAPAPAGVPSTGPATVQAPLDEEIQWKRPRGKDRAAQPPRRFARA